jgi:Ran GTPase-activating protein (RanGAP) involved in mRNA processing and transport
MNRITSHSRSSQLPYPINENDNNNQIPTRIKINTLLNEMQSCPTQRTHKEIENYAHQLATILENNPTFNELELTGAFLQNEAALTIVKALENNKTVTSLNLSNNYINANGLIAINTLLQTNNTLITLNLSRNSLGNTGAIAIGEILKNNKTLKTLYLNAIQLSCKGISAIAKGLQENSSLEEIEIKYNDFCYDSTEAIAQAIENNSTLKYIDLSGTCIDMLGVQGIAAALKNNTSIRNFFLSYEFLNDNESDDSYPDNFIRDDGFFEIDSDHEEKRQEHEKDFLKEYAVIQLICTRNHQREVLEHKGTISLCLLAPELPTEIANLIAQKLLITEHDAATLRQLGDKV